MRRGDDGNRKRLIGNSGLLFTGTLGTAGYPVLSVCMYGGCIGIQIYY